MIILGTTDEGTIGEFVMLVTFAFIVYYIVRGIVWAIMTLRKKEEIENIVDKISERIPWYDVIADTLSENYKTNIDI